MKPLHEATPRSPLPAGSAPRRERSARARWAPGLCVIALALTAGACSDGFGKPRVGPRLTIELLDAENVAGTRLEPLPLAVDSPQPFRIVVRAMDSNGNVDTSFNGFVRISAKPGAIEPIAGDGATGRNLELNGGESLETEVRLTNAYGTTYIVADDLGYSPGDPLAEPRPACANGVDDDGDGRIDFPSDEGCAFANDESEGGGSYAQGVSPPIYYRYPRVADVRGLKCDASGTCSGNGRTAYPKEQIQLDTGFHDKPDGTQTFDFDLVVTRIASDGFYVSDIKDTRGGFNSIFAFNFNSPPGMRVCDRLKTLGGTANEFFGFTQISYPTWTLEQWDPQRRPCLVPEPYVLTPLDVTPTQLLPMSGSLVRALAVPGKVEVKITPKFGPGLMPEHCPSQPAQQCARPATVCCETPGPTPSFACVPPAECQPPKVNGGQFLPTVDKGTSCDLDGNGIIDFTRGSAEERCAQACSSDPECTEYSNFEARSTFRITIKDLTNGNAAAVQADATTSAEFQPLEMKGQPLKAFTGTLHFFSGGSQFTIEARCKDDIITSLDQQPLPSDKACVHPRTIIDENPQ